MKPYLSPILSLCLIFCLILVAGAAEPQPITLEEARQRALQNNLTLSQARADEQAARWRMLWAVSEVLPHVSLNSSYSRFDEESVYRQNIMRDVIIEQYHIDPNQFPPFAYRNLYATSLSVDQPIYNGGVELTALRIAGTTKKQISAQRAAREKQLLLDVETVYYNLCRAQQALEVQKNLLDASRQYVARFRRRQDLGLAAPVEVMRWELQAANDNAALVEAQNLLDLAQISLARTLGSPAEETYQPLDLAVLATAGDQAAENLPALDTLWHQTQAASPDLQIMQRTVELQKRNVGLALSNFQPKLNFNYTYSWQADDDLEPDGFKSWVATVSLSMPLFASFGNVAQYQEARINVKKMQEAERDYELGLYAQMTAAHHELLAASERLKSAQEMQKQARKLLSIQENRSEQGLITNLELLDARNAVQHAELGLINARFEALIARAKLRRLAGE